MAPAKRGGVVSLDYALTQLSANTTRTGQFTFEVNWPWLHQVTKKLNARDQLAFSHTELGTCIRAGLLKQVFKAMGKASASLRLELRIKGARYCEDTLFFTWRNAPNRFGRLELYLHPHEPKEAISWVHDTTDAYAPIIEAPKKEKRKPTHANRPPPAPEPPADWMRTPYKRNAFSYQATNLIIYRVEQINAYAWEVWFQDEEHNVRTLGKTRDALDAWVLVEAYVKEPWPLDDGYVMKPPARTRSA